MCPFANASLSSALLHAHADAVLGTGVQDADEPDAYTTLPPFANQENRALGKNIHVRVCVLVRELQHISSCQGQLLLSAR
jgi:hypothetical protein